MSPYHHLKAIASLFPNTWKLIDTFRMEQEHITDWPEWCLLAKSGWLAIIADEYHASSLTPKQTTEASYLAAIAAWRYEQGIYRFHRDVYKKVIQFSLKHKFDPQVFYQLPEWCIYVKTPHLTWNNTALAGFWCHLEWDVKEKKPILKLVLNTFQLQVISLPLDKKVLNDLNKPTKSISPQGHQVGFRHLNNYSSLFIMISLVYFIAKSSTAIGHKGKHPEKVRPKLFKGVFKLFPATQPTLWHIDSIV